MYDGNQEILNSSHYNEIFDVVQKEMLKNELNLKSFSCFIIRDCPAQPEKFAETELKDAKAIF